MATVHLHYTLLIRTIANYTCVRLCTSSPIFASLVRVYQKSEYGEMAGQKDVLRKYTEISSLLNKMGMIAIALGLSPLEQMENSLRSYIEHCKMLYCLGGAL